MSDIGQPPELAWLPIGSCRADTRYQRTLESRASQELIRRIADSFSWAAFQAVLAAPDNDGGWWIIDGQHRVEAARLAGVDHVPAVVIKGGDVAELARAFVTANDNRVAINQFAKHRARRVAGDPEALAIDALCARYGIRVASTVKGIKDLRPGETLALGQFRLLPKKYGDRLAGHAIETIARAYRDQPGGLRAPFFQGAALWLSQKIAPADWGGASERASRGLIQRGSWEKLDLASSERRGRYGGTHVANIAAVINLWQGPATAGSIDRARLMAGR